MRLFPKWVWLALGGLLVVSLAVFIRSCREPKPSIPIPVDTANAAAWRARSEAQAKELADARAEASGLRGALQRAENRLRGIEVRQPERKVVFDTTLNITNEQVVRGVSIEGGRLDIEVLRPVAGGHQPELLRRIDVRNCDDGLSVQPDGVVCDRAAFGHLELFAVLGVDTELPVFIPLPRAAAGVSWQPSFRSTWMVDSGIDLEARVFVTVRKGVRLF